MKVRSLCTLLLLLCLVIIMLVPAVASAKPSQIPVAYKVQLSPVSMYGADGSASIELMRHRAVLNVTVVMRGLTLRQIHGIAITGFADGSKVKPLTPAADTNHDGLISYAESIKFTGVPLLWLKADLLSSRKRVTVFHGQFTGAQLTKLDPYNVLLSTRDLVVYGVNQWPSYANPFYDPTAPSACGMIAPAGS